MGVSAHGHVAFARLQHSDLKVAAGGRVERGLMPYADQPRVGYDLRQHWERDYAQERLAWVSQGESGRFLIFDGSRLADVRPAG